MIEWCDADSVRMNAIDDVWVFRPSMCHSGQGVILPGHGVGGPSGRWVPGTIGLALLFYRYYRAVPLGPGDDGIRNWHSEVSAFREDILRSAEEIGAHRVACADIGLVPLDEHRPAYKRTGLYYYAVLQITARRRP